jgi:hypothetical protein
MLLKKGIDFLLIYEAAYWSCGAGLAKRRSIRFALIFLFLFLSRKKEKVKRKSLSPIINQRTIYFILTFQNEITIDLCSFADEHFFFCPNN